MRQLASWTKLLVGLVVAIVLTAGIAAIIALVVKATRGKVHVTIDEWPSVARNPHAP